MRQRDLRRFLPLACSLLAYFALNGVWAGILIVTDACRLWHDMMIAPQVVCGIILSVVSLANAHRRAEEVIGGIMAAWGAVAVALFGHFYLFGMFCMGA